MNKIRVIDLLNKIANGEEVPKKIEYRNIKFVYDEDNLIYIVENYNKYNDLLMELSNHKGTDLNYEVEILEEKKIPEKLDIRQEKNCKNNWKWKVYGEDYSYNISTPQKLIADKVNEIIDYLKNKEE